MNYINFTSTPRLIPKYSISTESGSTIFFKDEQLWKALSPIENNVSGSDMSIKDLHFENALSSINITEDGIDMCVNDMHLEKQ